MVSILLSKATEWISLFNQIIILFFNLKLSFRLNGSSVGSVFVLRKHIKLLNFHTCRDGCQTSTCTSEQAFFMTHFMLRGHHLGTDHTPVTSTISIRRGSDSIALWLRCLCRVSYKLIHFCACLPFFPPVLLDVFGLAAACRSESW